MIARDLRVPPAALASWLENQQFPGVCAVVAAFDTVGIHFEPGAASVDSLGTLLETVPTDLVSATKRAIRIPVCYDFGLDLGEVAHTVGLTPAHVVQIHSSAVYECVAIGFCPGFPYLRGLPRELCGLPRLPSPRLKVPRGAVGITIDQCGIYPDELPGGWNLIGQTPVCMCDPEADYFPIVAGDRITFEPISQERFHRLAGAPLESVQ